MHRFVPVLMGCREPALDTLTPRRCGRQQAAGGLGKWSILNQLCFPWPRVLTIVSFLVQYGTENSPNNWVSNTAVCAVGIALATYGVWTYSADREVSNPTPSQTAFNHLCRLPILRY